MTPLLVANTGVSAQPAPFRGPLPSPLKKHAECSENRHRGIFAARTEWETHSPSWAKVRKACERMTRMIVAVMYSTVWEI